MSPLDLLLECLVELGEDPLAVGIIAFFALLNGAELLIKYGFKSARLLRLAAKLGSKRANKTYRKNLQLTLKSVRELRNDGGLKAIEQNVRSHRQIAIITALMGIFIYVIATYMGFENRTILIAGFLGGWIRFLIAALISFPAMKYARSMASDPAMWRRQIVTALTRIKR